MRVLLNAGMLDTAMAKVHSDDEQVRPEHRRYLACCVATLPTCLSMHAVDSHALCIEEFVWFHALPFKHGSVRRMRRNCVMAPHPP